MIMPKPQGMTGGSSGAGLGRRAAASIYVLSTLLAVAGAATTAWAMPRMSLNSAVEVPWFLLFPALLAASHLSIDFEYRGQARSVAFSQLPLALGAVFSSPQTLMITWLSAVLVDSVVLRRQTAIKTAFNFGLAFAEAGVALLAIGSLRPDGPDIRLWLALLLGFLVAEAISQLSLAAVMRLAGVPMSLDRLMEPVTIATGSTLVFTCLSVVAVAAVWTEPLVAFVIVVLVMTASLGYRAHRRLIVQEKSTHELYEFVKDLGPVDLSLDGLTDVLERVRTLLHTTTLDLALVTESGSWRHLTVAEDAHAHLVELDRLADLTAEIGGARLRERDSGVSDRMSTPLLGSQGVIGILSAIERAGDVRDFDMGDLRLLETIANQLATAIERGKLLTDLERAATTDPLTSLPNLTEISRRIDAQLAAHDGVLVAAMAVDSFREVNDTLGHQVGDDLLSEVTRRLHVAVPEAQIGRIGGGRFAVSVPASHYSGDPELLGLALRAQIEGGAQLGAVGTHVRLSVGCVSGPEHGTEAESLIRRAETAMYSARHAHGGPVLWEPAYEVQGQRRLAVVMALREALASGAIGVAFQPKVNTLTGDVTGVEALARWTHPALGAITPDEFIPLAEASGLMGPLTTTILRQALTAAKGWHRRAGHVGVAVNVSAETVLDQSFVTEVAALLTSTSTAPGMLTLELTEGVVVDDPALAAQRMQELRNLGVKLSVDDFGTGYSSLTYLKGLPVDEVKIDKGFVRNLVDDPADRAVVRAVVDIAHTLGMRVVAEGVEQEDQQHILRVLGVDELQGYYFARPMAAIDMAGWLRKREARAQL
ncbi:MAG: GGDEF domain-containing protein [Mycobacteriales bacterium]|nr:GGDEF domain-containing protein [Mycobacteriales bacterium]